MAGKKSESGTSRTSVRLTPAESRVLALLVTHLTLAGIGARLGSSRATVKTHVAHIYEKLGVNTRGEAVERAQQIGLLAGNERADALSPRGP